jgi:hypothetical protein
MAALLNGKAYEEAKRNAADGMGEPIQLEPDTVFMINKHD